MKKEYYLNRLTAEVNRVSNPCDQNQKLVYSLNSGVIWAQALEDADITKEEYGEIVNETHIKLESRLRELR